MGPKAFAILKNDRIYNQDNEEDNLYITNSYNWEIYQEPKKKVTKYLWACEDGKIGAYFNEKEYTKYGQEKGQNVPYNIRLDWSATEFEE